MAYAFAMRGASVVVNFVSDKTAPRAAVVMERIEKAGGKAILIKADVADAEQAKSLVDKTLTTFHTDKIDILSKNVVAICRRF